MNRSKNWRLYAASVGGLVIVVALWRWITTSPTLEAAAKRELDCAAREDSGCLMGYLTPEERAGLSLDQPKIQRLLSEYVGPAYREQTTGAAQETVTPLKDSGMLAISRSWHRDRLPPAERTCLMAATPDGPRQVNQIRSLILQTMLTKYRRSADEHQILAWLRGISADRDKLLVLGFNGIFDPDTKQVTDWSTLRENLFRKAKDHHIKDPILGLD
jgi:hypothetical protein